MIDVPTGIPSVVPISSCVNPSTSCITNTGRSLTDRASMAEWSFSRRSCGAMRVPAAGNSGTSSTFVDRVRSRVTDRIPLSDTLVAMVCSQVASDASPRYCPSRSNARMKVSCVKSCAKSASPARRNVSR